MLKSHSLLCECCAGNGEDDEQEAALLEYGANIVMVCFVDDDVMTESEATFSIALAICSCPTACCVGVVGCWRGNGWSSFIVIV